MPAALLMDVRERVAAALREGSTTRAAAERFAILISSAVRIGQRDRAGIGRERWRASPVHSGHRTRLLARLAEMPDLTMAALTAELAKRGIHVVMTTVWRFAKRAGQAFGTDQRAVASGRREGRDRLAGKTAPTEPETIQIDETWLEIDGRCPIGRRLIAIFAGMR